MRSSNLFVPALRDVEAHKAVGDEAEDNGDDLHRCDQQTYLPEGPQSIKIIQTRSRHIGQIKMHALKKSIKNYTKLEILKLMTQSKIMVTLQSQNELYKSFSLPDVPQSSKIYQNLRKIPNF